MFETLSRNESKDLNEALELACLQSAAPWSPSGRSKPLSSCVDRRSFLKGGAGLIGGLVIGGTLGALFPTRANACVQVVGPYGPPAPTADLATGLNLLKLPPGFSYRSYGWQFDPMKLGVPTPALHDGMAVVRDLGRWLVLVRNHEVAAGTAFGDRIYSPQGGGGTSNLIWDKKTEQFISAEASLSGTIRNCSGGVTPWGTWYTCEEVDTDTVSAGGIPHGYVFEVPASGGGQPEPFPAMGRFSHEAMAVDPRSGIVYETEDGPSVDTDAGSGFYRFLFNTPKQAKKGGTLQMLAVAGQAQLSLQTQGCNGVIYPVEWVTVPSPDPDVTGGEPSTFQQGFNGGGASFRRLEGCWYGDGKIFFHSTTGGPVSEGQIFMYDPLRETLQILFASPGQGVLENPDNIVVAPDGSLICCEDNSGATTNAAERLIMLPRGGAESFILAVNNLDFTGAGLGNYIRSQSGATFATNWKQQEWAGANFSPDGKWLFVNIQTPGITFAITGPWQWL
ncbi:MAG: alkaline phosphatase PhoX [Terriglobales bacterium]